MLRCTHMEMKTLIYNIDINAPVEKVWRTMLEKDTYEMWTTEFTPGSTYEGSWEGGSEIRFVDPAGNGMISEIAENRLHEYISIRHLGMIVKGETEYEGATEWAPSYENYTFTEADGVTTVKIEMQSMPDYEAVFNDMWPRALMKLKEICER